MELDNVLKKLREKALKEAKMVERKKRWRNRSLKMVVRAITSIDPKNIFVEDHGFMLNVVFLGAHIGVGFYGSFLVNLLSLIQTKNAVREFYMMTVNSYVKCGLDPRDFAFDGNTNLVQDENSSESCDGCVFLKDDGKKCGCPLVDKALCISFGEGILFDENVTHPLAAYPFRRKNRKYLLNDKETP